MGERVVVPYLRLVLGGPGNAVGVRGILRDLWQQPRVRRWASVYSSTGGDIRVWHWRWGPVIWGLEVVPFPRRAAKGGVRRG